MSLACCIKSHHTPASLAPAQNPHRCKCGTTVDTFSTHPLSCRFSAGRIPRHSTINDVVRCGLSLAGIPSMLEPSGLDRGDGNRPDGIAMYPYSRGRCLIWDATCVNTFASSNLIRAAGSVADSAEVRKIAKYFEMGQRFIFQPVAVETSGAIGKSTIQFFKIWVADLPYDFRINARVISCSREYLRLFSGGTPSTFAVVP